MFDSGERGSDGAQDLLFKHLQEAEVNEECASESACAADEDLRRAWAESFEMSVGAVLWALDSQAAAPALGEEPHQREPHECVAGCRVRQGVSQATCHIRELEAVSCARATVERDESDRLIFSMALRHPYRDFGACASTCARLRSRYGKSEEGATVC